MGSPLLLLQSLQDEISSRFVNLIIAVDLLFSELRILGEIVISDDEALLPELRVVFLVLKGLEVILRAESHALLDVIGDASIRKI